MMNAIQFQQALNQADAGPSFTTLLQKHRLKSSSTPDVQMLDQKLFPSTQFLQVGGRASAAAHELAEAPAGSALHRLVDAACGKSPVMFQRINAAYELLRAAKVDVD
jgi:hypothetical protein